MLAELEEAVEEERAIPLLLEWHKHPQDHGCPSDGAVAFHSLRNYWQERLEDADEEEAEVMSLKNPTTGPYRVRVGCRHPVTNSKIAT